MVPATDSDDLDLPPFDGDDDDAGESESERDAGSELDNLDEGAISASDLDDATAENDPLDDRDASVDRFEHEEDDDGTARGPSSHRHDDVAFGFADGLLLADENISNPNDFEAQADDASLSDTDLDTTEADSLADDGEEGFGTAGDHDDDEINEDDLPARDDDADNDGDGPSDAEAFFELSALAAAGATSSNAELRWVDRAWARLDVGVFADANSAARDETDADEHARLVAPGDDEAHRERDETWKRLEENETITAAAFLPGGSVALALDAPDRPQLVRILLDGTAHILAEVDLSAFNEELRRITKLYWDIPRGALVVVGPFGVHAFKPS